MRQKLGLKKSALKNQISLFIYISLFWFALEFCWQGLTAVILPSRLLQFVPGNIKGTTLAFLFSAGALISMLVQPLVGTMSDHSTHPLGRRRPFLISGAVLLSFSLLFFGLSPSFPFLFLSVILIFIATDIAQAPCQGFIPDLVPPEKRGKASGAMGFSTILGAIGGPLVAGFLLAADHFMIAIFVIVFTLLAATVITSIKVREKPLKVGRRLSRAEKLSTAFRFRLKEYPDFYWLQLARFFVLLALTTVLVYFFYFLKDIIGVAKPEKATGIVMSLAAVAALFSVLPSSALSDRVGRKPLLYLAGLLAVTAVVPLFFVDAFPLVLIIAVLFGLSFGMFSSVIWALNIDVIPLKEAGRYLGYTQFSTSLAQIVAPISGGPLIDFFRAERTGYNIIFGLVLFYLLIGLLILGKVKEKPRKSVE